MNAGFFLGTVQEEIGGGYTFVDSLLAGLKAVESHHKFFVFYYGKTILADSTGKITYVSLSYQENPKLLFKKMLGFATGKRANMLQIAVDIYRIDIMWYASTYFSHVNIPYACTIYDLEHRGQPFFPEVSDFGYWRATDSRYGNMIPRAAYVISGTEEGKKQIINYYNANPDRVRVIPFCVAPFALLQEEASLTSVAEPIAKRPYIFYPAQFWPHKNHISLLNTLKILREKYAIDLDLVLCGSDKGNLSYVKKKSIEYGLEDLVHFLGFVPQEDLYALYKNAFALVYPSLFGPDNLPPLEAFAIGCPVIAARFTGAIEQYNDAAMLVDPLSEDDIAQAVRNLYENQDVRQSLIDKGKERVKDMTSQQYVRRVISILDEFEVYRRCWSKDGKYRSQ